MSSISPCEGDGPGANPGFLTNFKRKCAANAQTRLALPQAEYCSRSNPRPGTKISKPVFGYELFVAHVFYRSNRQNLQDQVIHCNLKKLTGRISEFESGQQPFRQSAGTVLRMGRFNCGSIPHVG